MNFRPLKIVATLFFISIVSGMAFLLWIQQADDAVWYERSRYARLGDTVYYRSARFPTKVTGADVATFAPLFEKTAAGRAPASAEVYGKDKNAVYALGERMPSVDPESAESLGYRYLRDRTALYYEGTRLPGADPQGFTPVLPYYAHDGTTLYWKGIPIEGADIASLQTVMRTDGRKSDAYIRDANRVYYEEYPLPEADAKNFRELIVENDQWQIAYGYDGRRYFYRHSPLPDTISNTGEKIDPADLRLLVANRSLSWVEIFWIKDKVYYYNCEDGTLNLFFERGTNTPLEVLGSGLFRDDKHVYFCGMRWEWGKGKNRGLSGRRSVIMPAEGINPAAFRFIGENHNGDTDTRGAVYEAEGTRYFHTFYPVTWGKYLNKGYSTALDGYSESNERFPLSIDGAHEVFVKHGYRGENWIFPAFLIVLFLVGGASALVHIRRHKERLAGWIQGNETLRDALQKK